MIRKAWIKYEQEMIINADLHTCTIHHSYPQLWYVSSEQ